MSERVVSDKVLELHAALVARAQQRRLEGQRQARDAMRYLDATKARRWGLKGRMRGRLVAGGFQT